ncbi:class I SAM-dependent methyltransferase [Pseudomonas guariconensis]|uniref:class I SAM-dependent methyltransferase n=2 Tax=Pseudomonas TaxID=286 RepID=UPI0015DC512A|nr:class I SAM-dependent methyltransferase [Pseudomonas sp. BYT-1]BBR55125.1 hypothetical protein WP4W18C03_34520 [Pseudomonas putida]
MVSPSDFIARACICCDSVHLDKSAAVLMPFVAKRVFDHEPVEITAEWGLRDLRVGMAYTLCNSLQCQACGALFLDYRFSDAQMAALYSGYRGAQYTREREQYEPGYAAIAEHYQGREAYIADIERWLAPHLPERPAVLDWGGGSGLNTPFRGRHSLLHVHDISAVELAEGAEAIGPEQLARGRYDLITCCQVLEHVPSPRALIKQMLPAMDRDTLLYLEVPHEGLMRERPGSLALAASKRHWHEHINFFTELALQRLIEGCGLKRVDSHLLPVDLGWRQAEVIGVLVRLA